MKKISLVLVIFILLSLVSCGSKKKNLKIPSEAVSAVSSEETESEVVSETSEPEVVSEVSAASSQSGATGAKTPSTPPKNSNNTPAETRFTLLNMDIVPKEYYNGWLYFYEMVGEKQHLFRMRLDGSGKKEILNTNGEQRHRDVLYYFEHEPIVSDTIVGNYNYICKVNIDGTGKKRLLATPVAYFNFAGDFIYYCVNGEDTAFRMRLDGTQQEKTSIPIQWGVNIFGERIFFKRSDDNKFHNVRLDGSDEKIMSLPEGAKLIGTSGDYVFFETSAHIGRIKFDGTDYKKLFDRAERAMLMVFHIDKDFIYFFQHFIYSPIFTFDFSTCHVFRMKHDGTGLKELYVFDKTDLNRLYFDSDYIFSLESSDDGMVGIKALVRMAKDGSKRETLVDLDKKKHIIGYFFAEGKLYIVVAPSYLA